MKIVLWILILAALVPSAGARPPIYSDYEKVCKAELIIFGEVVEFGKDTGCAIKIERVFKGQTSAGNFAFPYTESYLGSVESPAVSLQRGDKAYLFLSRNVQGEFELLANSQGIRFVRDKDVQSYDAVIRDLVSFAETRQSSMLRNMMNKGGESRRAALGVVRAHASLLKADGVVSEGILSCLMDSDPLVRRDAVWLIGQLGIPEGKRVLREHLNDPDESVRQAVGVVLQRMPKNKDEDTGNFGDTRRNSK